MNPLNQFSFLILAGLVLAGLAAMVWLTGLSRRKLLALGAIGAALGVSWLGLRTGAGAAQDLAQAELVIRDADRPVLVEFYSDYCLGCLAARPTLDALEVELRNELKVIRLDVASDAGRELGQRLGLRATPTFILFDPDGKELWRMLGGLDAEAVRQVLGES